MRRLAVLILVTARVALGLPNEVDYAIRAELDVKTARITATETVRLTNRTGRPLAKLYFHVYPNAFDREQGSTYLDEMRKTDRPESRFLTADARGSLVVSRVAVDGRPASYRVTRDRMEVALAFPLATDAGLTLDLGFVTQLAAVAERSGTWDGNFSVSQWFPKLVVYDAKGWALEHNGAYHFTGEFYGDFGSYDVALTLPSDVKVGATGHEVAALPLPDGRTRHEFHADKVHDFAWAADARYEESTITVAGTTVHVLTRHPESKSMVEYARRIIEYDTRRIGPYPYADFTVAETYYNGTMEYPQMIFVRTVPAWLGRWVEHDLTRLVEIYVAHETTHQWFFGAVGNNEMVDAWLDEGFTTYFEEAYLRDTYGADDNIVALTNLLRIPDRRVGDALWRYVWPVNTKPIQTPAYQFVDPNHYYGSVYYGTALFFRQFEAIVGREKFEAMLHEYFRRQCFRNATPEDWYAVVRELAGAEAERWWRRWITGRPRSDYAVSGVASVRLPDGRYLDSFTVTQKGDHLVPVEAELVEESGERHRLLVGIRDGAPEKRVELTTKTPPAGVEVDPDRTAPDLDRFNNRPGLLPDVALWPFTTSRLPDDAIVVLPFPYFQALPGIGPEAGLGLVVAHDLDWYGTLFVGNAFQTNRLTLSADFESISPIHSIGWELHAVQNVLADRKSVYLRKPLGPVLGHDPSQTLLIGPEYAGDLGDGYRRAGLGVEYRLSNIDNGEDVRWSLAVHDSIASGVDRLYAKGRVILPLGFRNYFDVKGIYGGAFGTLGRSFQYDLQDADEGGMRFDWIDIGAFRVSRIAAANMELRIGIPYGTWGDALQIIHAPAWDVHLFSDVSNSPELGHALFDAGFGTRFQFSTGTFGSLGLNLEIMPYQNALAPTGWRFPPVVFLSLAEDF